MVPGPRRGGAGTGVKGSHVVPVGALLLVMVLTGCVHLGGSIPLFFYGRSRRRQRKQHDPEGGSPNRTQIRQAPDDTLFRATTHRETGTRRTDDGTRTLARVRLRLTWPTVGP